jgi:adenylylsulfate kinase-like enzyme
MADRGIDAESQQRIPDRSSRGGGEPVMNRNVVLLAGLPASGKTTTAHRVHHSLGGVLIRSCDVYHMLGISVPEWVRRTRGFSENARAYE